MSPFHFFLKNSDNQLQKLFAKITVEDLKLQATTQNCPRPINVESETLKTDATLMGRG